VSQSTTPDGFATGQKQKSEVHFNHASFYLHEVIHMKTVAMIVLIAVSWSVCVGVELPRGAAEMVAASRPSS